MTTTDLTKTESDLRFKAQANELSIPADVSIGALESAIGLGDFSKLTSQDRLKYIAAVCKTVGLNPLTRPFEIIELDGKLILYATRSCTDQLRMMHKVNVTLTEPRVDHGCLIISAQATLPGGRTDTSLAAVPITYPDQAYDKRSGGWKPHWAAGKPLVGKDWANAIMKCETKAKRRVTLSICGLGLIDESEVDDVQVSTGPGDVPALVNTETSADRAAALNAIEAEVMPNNLSGAPGEGGMSQPRKTEVGVDDAPPSKAATDSPGTAQSIPVNSLPAQGTAPVDALAERKEPAKVQSQDRAPESLDEATFVKLGAILMDVDGADEFLVARGYLKAGETLQMMRADVAKRIISNPKGFQRSIEAWRKCQ